MKLPKHLIDRRDTVALALDHRANELHAAHDRLLKALTAYNQAVDFYNRALGHATGYTQQVAEVIRCDKPVGMTPDEIHFLAEYHGVTFRPVDLFQIVPMRPRTNHREDLLDLPLIS